MQPSGKTTVGTAVIGAAVGTIAVFVETTLGLHVPPEVAAAEATVFTGLFGAIFPLK